MSIPSKDTLACDALTIGNLLWGAESMFDSLSFNDAKGGRLRDLDAALAAVIAARKMAERLSDDIDKLPK